MATASWMWADASLIGGLVAAKNPLRWSKEQSIAAIVAELEKVRNDDKLRPIRVRINAGGEGPPAAAGGSQLEFTTAAAAVEGLRAQIPEAEAGQSRPRLLSTNPAVELPFSQELLRAHFDRVTSGQRIVAARWMWGDAGASAQVTEYRALAEKNPFRWSALQDLGRCIGTLEAQTAQRPVTVELTSGDWLVSAVRSNAPTPGDAAVVLRALQGQQSCLRGRDEFPEEQGVTLEESQYGRYVKSALISHGGPVGAGVQYSSAEPYMSLQSGMKGIIREFDDLSSIKVDWGACTLVVSLAQCTLIATSDKTLRVSGVDVDSVLQSAMTALVGEMQSGNLNRFEKACKRLLSFQDERARHHAMTAGVCSAAVSTMAANGATKSVQHAGSMAIWWLTFPYPTDAEVCREHAHEAGSIAVLAEVAKTFPHDKDLQDCCRQASCYVVDGRAERRDSALAAGIPAEWVQVEVVS